MLREIGPSNFALADLQCKLSIQQKTLVGFIGGHAFLGATTSTSEIERSTNETRLIYDVRYF